MNILFLSNIKGIPSAGPTYSVPNRILAQQEYDNVFWYNTCAVLNDDWIGKANYHDLREYPSKRIADLPEPFNKPDIIVIEQFYNHGRDPYLNEVMNSGVPYIIVPRSELTRKGQARHRLKKIVANAFVFNKFAKRAAAIQYLTEQERIDSGDSWNKKAIIIPNGIHMPDPFERPRSEYLRCVCIGRLEPYQKGLDLLIESCARIRLDLIRNKVKIDLYGSNKEGKATSLEELIKVSGLESILSVHTGVYGEEKKRILMNSDVFIMTSRFEGHPMALIEALSYGLPALVTTGSNMRSEIENSGAGWGCDTKSESIANALQKMISKKSDFSSVSKRALDLATTYSWEKIAKEFHDEICKI